MHSHYVGKCRYCPWQQCSCRNNLPLIPQILEKFRGCFLELECVRYGLNHACFLKDVVDSIYPKFNFVYYHSAGQGPVAGCCANGYESYDCMKVEGLVDELSVYLFVKKDPVLQSCFVFVCMNDTFLLVSVPKQILQRWGGTIGGMWHRSVTVPQSRVGTWLSTICFTSAMLIAGYRVNLCMIMDRIEPVMALWK